MKTGNWLAGICGAALCMVAAAQPVGGPPMALPAWDAFVVLPWRLGVDGTVVACAEAGAEIERGRCFVNGWVRKDVGAAQSVPVQVALESYLKGRLPATKRPMLVAVGPGLDGSKYPSLSATSFVAYYKVVQSAE